MAEARADRQLFLSLDGLRGAAAVLVVLFHDHALIGAAHPDDAYLAVDLFFLLSGCVMEAAYGRKLASGMPLRTLLAVRLIRLWPLYALGLALGTAGSLALIAGGRGYVSLGTTASAAALGLLMLPALPTGYNIAPLNTPGWSVIFELAINAVYGTIRRRLTTAWLAAVVVLSGTALVPLILRHGTLNVGFLWSEVPLGLVRVTCFFFGGVLLLRLPRPAMRASTAALLLPLAVLLLIGRSANDPRLDLARAMLAFPLLVWLGLWLQPGARLARLFRFGGLTSYALYAVHVPLWTLVAPSLAKRVGGAIAGKLVAAVLLAALVALAAWLDRAYDTPVRARLTGWATGRETRRKLRRDLAKEPAASAP